MPAARGRPTVQDRSVPPHEQDAVGGPVRGALADAGLTTWEQVDALGDGELLALHGVGPKGVRLLRAVPDAPA
ncbi:hypothetical protein [Oryzobacter terrae]|uniref:hypothetical protein n=1 Tax=Oryzobacter terrae TaxID=1620385 RepID=UPI00366D2A40